MEQELISIIVPVYNVERHLPKCLDSIINQAYKNIEIILIDDGSTDNSGVICDEYKLKDNRINVIHQANHGIGYTRNIGLQNANGKFIGFVDSDDFIDENMFLRLYNEIIKTNADIACCANYRIEFGNEIRITHNNCNKKFFVNSEVLKSYLKCDFGFVLWNKLFTSNLIKDIKFPSDKIGEDTKWLVEVFAEAKTVAYTKEPLYYYVKRENSLTEEMKKYDLNMIQKSLDINKYVFNFVKNNNKDCLNIVINNYITFLIQTYQDVCMNKNAKLLQNKILDEIRKVLINNHYYCINFKIKKKLNILLISKKLFEILAYYEKYIGGIEKKFRKYIKRMLK